MNKNVSCLAAVGQMENAQSQGSTDHFVRGTVGPKWTGPYQLVLDQSVSRVDSCSKSLDPMAVTSDQVTAALKYVQYKAMYSSNGARQGWLGGPLGGALGGLGVMGGGFNGVNHNQALNNAMLSGQNINSLIGLQMMNNPGASLADYSQLQSLAGSQDSYEQNVQDQLVANAMGLNTGKTNLIQAPYNFNLFKQICG